MYNIGKKSVRAKNPFAGNQSTLPQMARKERGQHHQESMFKETVSAELKNRVEFALKRGSWKLTALIETLGGLELRDQYEVTFLEEASCVINSILKALNYISPKFNDLSIFPLLESLVFRETSNDLDYRVVELEA